MPKALNQHPAPRRIPIKHILVFGLGLLMSITLGGTLYTGYFVALQNTEELLSDKIESTLDIILSRVEHQLQPVEHQANQIAQAFKDGTLSLIQTEKLEVYFTGLLSASPQVSAVALALPDKTMMVVSRPSNTIRGVAWPKAKNFEPLYKHLEETGMAEWRNPVWSENLHQVIMTHHTPLFYNEQFLGTIIQTVPISELSHYLSQQSYLDGIPFIYYGTNKLIAHPKLIEWLPAVQKDLVTVPTTQDIGEEILVELLATPGRPPGMLKKLQKSQGKIVKIGSQDYAIFTRSILRYGPEPWTIGLYLVSRAAPDIIRRLTTALVIGSLLLIITVGCATFAGSRLSRPIRALAAAMLRVRDGKVTDVDDLPRSQISELDDAAQSFNDMLKGLRERALIRQTLGRYVPESIADTLLKDGGRLETEEVVATVLFADIEKFTNLTESLGPEGIVDLLNAYFNDMVEIIERHGGVVTQFQGDAILATFNVPVRDPNHAMKGVQAAIEIRKKCQTNSYGGQSVRTRIGLNTGYLIAGAVGAQGRLNYTVHGDAVNLAARLEGLNKDYGTYILTTQSTVDLCPGINAVYVGETTVRGQTSPVKLYTLNEIDNGS